MSTMITPTSADRSRTTELRRGLSLARAEALLVRNHTALFPALLIPLMLIAIVAVLPDSPTKAPLVLGTIVGTSLVFVVYYTLVTSTVPVVRNTCSSAYTPVRPDRRLCFSRWPSRPSSSCLCR